MFPVGCVGGVGDVGIPYATYDPYLVPVFPAFFFNTSPV